MAKIKFTKNELKRQRDSFNRFNRYLPMLQLKKKQLQAQISKTELAIASLNRQLAGLKQSLQAWVDVFAEGVDLSALLKLSRVNIESGNVAGIDVPLFAGVEFKIMPYDDMSVALWVDEGLEALKQAITLKAELLVRFKERDILRQELRITSQRVNLFEKVKIPEAVENIRVIQIHLGDLQTANVIRGKIAKNKIEKARELAAL